MSCVCIEKSNDAYGDKCLCGTIVSLTKYNFLNYHHLFFVFRSMFTVLVFSSAKFASENCQILTGVTSKLPW